MDQYISEEVPQLEGEEAKDTHKKNLVKYKRIIADSIKHHLIPHVSSFKIIKEVFDALTNMLKGKNINQKMTLRNLLKNLKIQNSETIWSYFRRVSQIKEQLEACHVPTTHIDDGGDATNTLLLCKWPNSPMNIKT